MKFTLLLMVLLVCFLSACNGNAPVTPTLIPTATETRTPIPTVIATATPTSLPTTTFTPEPYWEYSISYLRSRIYGGGQIEITQTVGKNSAFTRHLFRYDSDGLSIYGFADVPHGEGPFPVIIALHGYIEPEIYQTLDTPLITRMRWPAPDTLCCIPTCVVTRLRTRATISSGWEWQSTHST